MSNQLRILQDKLICQEEEICQLEKELSEYNDTMVANECLTKKFNELQRWVEEAKSKLKERDTQQSNIIESKAKKIKKAEMNIIQLSAKNQKLNDLNKCLSDQLKTINRTEERLLAEIEILEASINKLESDMCQVQNELLEKSCLVEKLTKQLKIKQEELLAARKQHEECKATVVQLEDRCKVLEAEAAAVAAKLEECQTAVCRLRERCRDLEADLECTRAKLEDVKKRAAATEARLKVEAEALAKELECRARRLREAEATCDEAKRRLVEEQGQVTRLEAVVAELQAANERERYEAEAREQRLQRDVCERGEEVRKLSKQLATARRDHEEAAAELKALSARARANEVVLENARRSLEARDRVHDEARERLEREKAVLTCEVQQKTAAVAELERQVCRLRDDLRRASSSNNRCGGGGQKQSSLFGSTCASPPARARPATDDCYSGATADDSFINGLKRLYCDLEQLSENKTRRN